MIYSENNFPPSVDLRSSIDTVYDQSNTGACGPHSLVNALDTMFDNAGHSKRFSRSWLYWFIRVWQGLPGADIGSTYESIKITLKENGIEYEEKWPWDNVGRAPLYTVGSIKTAGYSPVQFMFPNDIKRLLCMGYPVIYRFKPNQDFMYGQNTRFNKNWKTHTWDITGDPVGDHYVCIQGYDDETQRFLVENSWGPDWGDGGFFGLPYDFFNHPAVFSGACGFINKIDGFTPVCVKDYMSTPMYLNSIEAYEFVSRSKEPFKAMLMAEFARAGIQGLVDMCKTWGISDKHLELIAGWERGAVYKYKVDNPQVNWDGFEFDTI